MGPQAKQACSHDPERLPNIFETELQGFISGSSNSTTVSRISDIVVKGIPIFADAAKPESYASIVEKVDMIYQDIAQREQATIALKNSDFFLNPEGSLIIALKARSIDSIANPKEVLRREAEKLASAFEILSIESIEPYYKDHAGIVAKRQNY